MLVSSVTSACRQLKLQQASKVVARRQRRFFMSAHFKIGAAISRKAAHPDVSAAGCFQTPAVS
jgi:hypothetical protein